MKKNLWLLGLLVFIFAGCDTDSEADTWSEITSLHQLQGTWVGTQNRTMPLKDILEAAGYLEYADPVQVAAIKDINVTVAVHAVIIIVAHDDNEGIMSGTTSTTIAFSGGNIARLWPLIKAMYEDMLPSDVIINDKNHSITMNNDMPPDTITLEELEDQLQINQTGTRLRTEIDPGDLGEWGSLLPSEVIFTKVS